MRKRIAIGIGAFALAALVAVGALGTVLWADAQLDEPLVLPPQGLVFEVPSGAAFRRVTAELARHGVVQHPWVLDWHARISGSATAIHAGEYDLRPGLTGRSLLDKLVRGEVLLHQFTIVEGLRFADVLVRLREHPAIEPGSASGGEIMAALGAPDLHPEGQFLPDTYSFPRGTSDLAVLRMAHVALTQVLDDAWRNRSETGVLETPYEGLVLASIIEKETSLESERALISGVFHRRLMLGMRLQTDPTVIYGLGEGFDGDLTRADLAADTPYNTYTRGGLPPTPIALAGRGSILAAFAPAETEALYFVATGEPDGSHAFSSTLEEHNAAVRRYLDRQRAGD